MASAPSTARAREDRRADEPARPKPRVVRPAPRGRTIRWDRVSRGALLFVLLGLVYLYISPTIAYLETYGEAGDRRAEVQKLKRENQRLRDRRQALQDPRVLEREARRLGMVKPGERGYIVKDLPK